jgi:hypothetical protein
MYSPVTSEKLTNTLKKFISFMINNLSRHLLVISSQMLKRKGRWQTSFFFWAIAY